MTVILKNIIIYLIFSLMVCLWLYYMEKPQKHHYYCLSYAGTGLSGEYKGRSVYASVYIGVEEKYLIYNTIMDEKESAGVDESAILISASYLGYMTQERFNQGRR